MKKPQFKKSEMHGDLPFKKGTVASASKIKRKGGEKKKMSYGKLNIWIRNLDCSLVRTCWMTDLVIKTCNGDYLVDMDPSVIEELRKRYSDYDSVKVRYYKKHKRINLRPGGGEKFNHIEVDVPPGCYVVWTRVCYGHNEETNKVMAIVDCGEEVCVNLLLNRVETCANEVLYPYALRAMDKRLPEKEVATAIKSLMEVGEIPKDEFVRELEERLEELQEAKEEREAQRYLEPTAKILEIVKSLRVKEE